jgi:hypothetical protein
MRVLRHLDRRGHCLATTQTRIRSATRQLLASCYAGSSTCQQTLRRRLGAKLQRFIRPVGLRHRNALLRGRGAGPLRFDVQVSG